MIIAVSFRLIGISFNASTVSYFGTLHYHQKLNRTNKLRHFALILAIIAMARAIFIPIKGSLTRLLKAESGKTGIV
jgi:hypothetical protein